MAYRRCHDCCGVLAQQGNELIKMTVIQNCWTLMPYPVKGRIYAYTLGDMNVAHLPLPNGPCLQCFNVKYGNLSCSCCCWHFFTTIFFGRGWEAPWVYSVSWWINQGKSQISCVLPSPPRDFLQKHPIAWFCFLSPWETIHKGSKMQIGWHYTITARWQKWLHKGQGNTCISLRGFFCHG